MRRNTVAIISVAASLALAACAERDTTSPRSIASGDPSFARGGSTCNFSTVKSAAQAYFTSNQDPVYDMIKVMQSAFQTANGGNVAATPEGWVILSRVADRRLTSDTRAGDTGAAFVVSVAACMADLAANSSPLALPAALTDNNNANLIRVLNSGIFDVRQGGATGGPAAGKNKAGNPAARSLGSPIWGVETQTPTSNWPGTIKYAVVGYPIVDGNPLLLHAQQIDQSDALQADYVAAGTWPFNAFELLTLPTTAVTDHSSLRVGICVPHEGTANDGSLYYLVHNDAEILPNSVPGALCDLTVASGLTAPWYTRLAQGAANFFKPATLFAFQERDFIGGLPSGWSPQEAGQLDASGVTITITTQPKNNVRDSTYNTLTITATLTGKATVVPGVSLDSIAVLNNQGSPAGAVIVHKAGSDWNLPQITDKNGLATAQFQIGKPGAYYLVVYASLDGTPLPASATSVKFNVKN